MDALGDSLDHQKTATQKTPLHGLHHALNAKMAAFAGYDMPISYPDGTLAEHKACRNAAALFDVSHMGQIKAHASSYEALATALESLLPANLLGLKPGRQVYSVLLNERGGVIDDLMIARLDDSLHLVVNAACKQADLAFMHRHLPEAIHLTPLEDRGLIALQGPNAERILGALDGRAHDMRFMDIGPLDLAGVTVIASRSGYTGEDGYEISIPADKTEEVAKLLLAHPDVTAAGLAARDMLRLEAGLPLYGHDLGLDRTPVASSISFAIAKTRREGGARPGGFPGADRILRELSVSPASLRVGLRPEGRAPLREPTELFADEGLTNPVGAITSGGHSPTLGGPIAMAQVSRGASTLGHIVYAERRGKPVACTVSALPFVPPHYKR